MQRTNFMVKAMKMKESPSTVGGLIEDAGGDIHRHVVWELHALRKAFQPIHFFVGSALDTSKR